MKKIFTLIAVFATVLTANAGEIFRFELASDVANLEIAAQDQETLGYHATISEGYTITDGASVILYNGHGSSPKNLINGGKIDLGGSGGSYAMVTLPKGVTLKTGDVIKIVNASRDGGAVGFTDKKISSDNMINYEYTVPAGGEGESSFYIWRGASSIKFTGIVVERNENQVIAPAITVADGKVVMTCSTEGASIYYATTTGVTAATGTLYTEPLAITSSVTYYAIATKEGMDVSKESSKAVEYNAIPAEATLEATLKAPRDIASGEADEALENITDGTFTAVKVEDDAVLSNSAAWNDAAAFKGLVKVKKTITITTTGEKNIVGIKVIGISNSDGNVQPVTATGMKFTTDSNMLPARDNESQQPGTVELVAETPAKEFKVYFSGQARAMFEVYTGTADTGIKAVEAEQNAAAFYNLAGQKVSEGFKGIIVKNGKKVVMK